MAISNFLLDVVVTQFESQKVLIEDPRKVKVELTFNKRSVLISASRINVSDFKPGTEVEFKVTSEELRKDLQQCGMPITVNYGRRFLGTGNISFPQDIVDSIDEGMADLIYTANCNFEREAEVAGALELNLRLVSKRKDGKESNCRCLVDKSINPQDILFIMSKSQRRPFLCDPCLDACQAENNDRILQLGGYRSQDSALQESEEIFKHDPVGKSICSEIKKLALDYEQAINSISNRTGQPKQPCRTADALRSPCCQPCNNLNINKQPNSQSSLVNVPSFFNVATSQHMSTDFCNLGQTEQPLARSKCFCPVCLNNKSWLPKFSSCPKCGIKPMPIFKELYRQEEPTVDNILLQHLDKPPKTIDQLCMDHCNEDDCAYEQPEYHCTCKYGRLCTRCRVREQYPEYVCDRKAKPVETKDESEDVDHCVVKTESEQYRPFLSSVFSELCFLYNVKPEQHNVEKLKENNVSRSRNLRKAPIVHLKKQTKQSVTGRPGGKHISRNG